MSFRSALADRAFQENTTESLRAAVALAPGNATYHALLGEHMEGLGLNPDREFAQAAALSPRDSQFLIRLGFRAETEGDYPRAERVLLQAAAVDKKLNPKWSLASFYFRRGRTAEFWKWASLSLVSIRTDPVPVFQLMWEVAPDARAIEPHLPDRRNILQSYLFFLLDRHPEPAVPSAGLLQKIAALAESEDTPALTAACDRLLTRQPSLALTLWNALCHRRLLPFLPLQPGSQMITDADFRLFPFLQQGFDWRTPSTEGVSVSAAEEGNGISVRLSGKQPEEGVLLWQPVPTRPGVAYQITYQYRALDPAALSGLTWEAVPSPAPGAAGVSTRAAALTPGNGWQPGALSLVGDRSGLALLRLHYHRPLGSTRAEGSVSFRAFRGREVTP